MADEPKVTNHTEIKAIAPRRHWLAQNSTTVIFLIIVIALVGGYQAFKIPIAVFPSTDFPRIVIGIDNGVMPIDQMMVTITRPVEQAVNSVQGLETVRSITSRGSAEVDLFFNWQVICSRRSSLLIRRCPKWRLSCRRPQKSKAID